MEEYKKYLLTGVKFEKLKMQDASKTLYKYYLQKVATLDYINVLEFFYGAFEIETENYEETINKAYLIEKLKKLYLLLYSYRFNWIDQATSNKIYDDTLITFFKWVSTTKTPSNSDIKIIDDMISILQQGVGFNFKINQSFSYSLIDTVSLLQTKQLKLNGKEFY